MFQAILPSNLRKRTLYENDGDACKPAVVTSSCDWEPVQGKSFETRQQSRNRRGRLSNLLAASNNSTTGERAIWLAVTSGGLLVWPYFSRRIQIKSCKTCLNHKFPLVSLLSLLTVPMPWFHCKAWVYNKMIIASFICSLFKPPSLLCWKIVLFLKHECQQGYSTLLLPAV